MKTALILAVGLATVRLSAAEVDWSKLPPASTTTGVTFEKDIAPLLKASCVRCHGAERPRAQLRLDSLEGVMKGTKQGSIVTPGDSANSLLVKSISQLDPQTAMPPKRGPRGPRPGGTNAPAMQPRDGGPEGNPPPPVAGGQGGPGGDNGPGGPPPGGPGGPGGPQGTNGPGGMRQRNFGPPSKPLTADEVGLVRAWIDQGAK